ncbi:Tat pathway signal sequence domain protein [Streptomyces sp. NRRL S-87]|uniref:Tat pathway signal sequence domain protein n=1 Tax=Streptomyces sp. NRRL S-87 TaxID=1463920 RepID=UPI001F1F2379|nr:Tat pathway signal sequence domain protein [Streptomyces sp. NRRL S-87]
MSGTGPGGIGPVEPGDETWGGSGDAGADDPWDTAPGPRPGRGRRGRGARLALALALTAAAAGAGGYLYALRSRPPAPPPPPYPSQVFSVTYGGPVRPTPAGTAFAFTVFLRTTAGPPVSLERIGQPWAALSVTTDPHTPLVVHKGRNRAVLVQIQVKDCMHVPRNAGLPFLEVTLSNGSRKEDHSYILGDRYARELATALSDACPDSRDAPQPAPS